MNIQDIYQNLDSFSIDDLRDLNEAVVHTIKAKRQQQSAIKKLSLRVGDKVSWDGRKGYKEGTIIKINSNQLPSKVSPLHVNLRHTGRPPIGHSITVTTHIHTTVTT